MSDKQDLGLGEIIPPSRYANRDAIHIAVVPMIVGERMNAGDHVRIMVGTTDRIVQDRSDYYGAASESIGIVDPFIKQTSEKWYLDVGERVWVFLYPNTITGLRHEWTHPAFVEANRKTALMSDAEKWMRQFADRWNFDYNEMLDAATSTEDSEWGSYITARGKDLHSRGELGDDYLLFWQYLEQMTGRTFSEEHREKVGWSCSC